ncbi:MAG: right-handed parallel beta-helix repeat-containing protein [Clostridia bacterium]|nr:right-handed parallel beta-helix repeat-containing protein [Clostridia bacterium]
MRELHVSKAGNDRNCGSIEAPFLTISKAASAAVEGDIVIVHEGTYREWVNPKNGGRDNNHRIIYTAAENEKVIIKGSEVVGNWEKDGDIWKTKVDNKIFGKFNPFEELLAGDWLIKPADPYLHLGKVYLDGKALKEMLLPGDVATNEMSWYAQVLGDETEIFANFAAADPNSELTEINVRMGCFFPDKNGVNYITVRGFEMAQAASPWAPPTAVQPGMIWTHWSKGWIIENNILHDARCNAISLGKEETTGDNLSSKYHRKPGYQTQQESVFSALRYGWCKELTGSHIIRNNVIYDCGQTGIVGHMGGAFCEICHNHIYNIANTNEIIEGHEMGGIKLHAPIDTYIHDNYIHDSHYGIWLDWQAQGARVSSNLFVKNGCDLVLEAAHGPLLVDNNVLCSESNMLYVCNGTAFVHNLFWGKLSYVALKAPFNRYRSLPYHLPHSTQIMGTAMLFGADDRMYQNIFINQGNAEESADIVCGTAFYEGCPISMEEYTERVLAQNATLVSFNETRQPAYINRNCYANGAKAFSREEENAFLREVSVKLTEETDQRIYLEIDMPEGFLGLGTEIMGTHNLGITRISEQGYENADGTELRIEKDYWGNTRNPAPVPGPFENLMPGHNRLCVFE